MERAQLEMTAFTNVLRGADTPSDYMDLWNSFGPIAQLP